MNINHVITAMLKFAVLKSYFNTVHRQKGKQSQ